MLLDGLWFSIHLLCIVLSLESWVSNLECCILYGCINSIKTNRSTRFQATRRRTRRLRIIPGTTVDRSRSVGRMVGCSNGRCSSFVVLFVAVRCCHSDRYAKVRGLPQQSEYRNNLCIVNSNSILYNITEAVHSNWSNNPLMSLMSLMSLNRGGIGCYFEKIYSIFVVW